MLRAGRLQGAAARRFFEFCYRMPVMRPFNPNELLAVEMGQRTVDLADYEIRFGQREADGLTLVTLTMLPNKYTQAKQPRIVARLRVANALMFRDQYCDEILRIATQ